MKQLVYLSIAIGVAVALAGCASTTIKPDGTKTTTAPDNKTIRTFALGLGQFATDVAGAYIRAKYPTNTLYYDGKVIVAPSFK